jgi:uncharacterized membrane protein required for colicin V production
MNAIDFIPVILIPLYMVVGLLTGVLRRLIGLVALYIAFFAATNMGLQIGGILQQTSTLETPDARVIGFFSILVIVLVIIDGAAQLVHKQIQVEAIVLNKPFGVVVGLITAVMLSVLVTYEFSAAANPVGGGALNGFQLQVRDIVHGSKVAVPLKDALKRPVVTIFQPVLPSDPQLYFSTSPVS